MVFLEVEDVEKCWRQLHALDLPAKYIGARITPIRTEAWGRECFLHDPSGILWHFGEYNKQEILKENLSSSLYLHPGH